jgi:hypothetical protein
MVIGAYGKGEKKAAAKGNWDLIYPCKEPLHALFYGYPPGKHEITLDLGMGKTILKPLLDEIVKYVTAAPGTNKKGLRVVELYGFTDMVPGKETDKSLRLKRAKSFKQYLLKLLKNSGRVPKINDAPAMLRTDDGKIVKFYVVLNANTALGRTLNRSVGVYFGPPPLPPECYAKGTKPTLKKSLQILQKALGLPKTNRLLGPRGVSFFNLVWNILATGGNDEYLLYDDIKKAGDQVMSAWRKEYGKISKLTPKQLETLGNKYQMSSYPSVRSEQIRWRMMLTDRELYSKQPSLFILRTKHLETTLKEWVRTECNDFTILNSYLRNFVNEIEKSREGVRALRNLFQGLLAGLAGVKAMKDLEPRFVVEARKWIDEKEKMKNNIYWAYKKSFPGS